MRCIMRMLCCGLIFAGTAFAEDERILLQFSAKGAQMSPLFTAKDHWEVRWNTDNGLSIVTFDRDGIESQRSPMRSMRVAGAPLKSKVERTR